MDPSSPWFYPALVGELHLLLGPKALKIFRDRTHDSPSIYGLDVTLKHIQKSDVPQMGSYTGNRMKIKRESRHPATIGNSDAARKEYGPTQLIVQIVAEYKAVVGTPRIVFEIRLEQRLLAAGLEDDVMKGFRKTF